jgi:glyoxylase I family protein
MSQPAAPPFGVKGIEHVLLLVRGMDEALAFYEKVLGARLETKAPKYAMAEMRLGESHLDLVDVDDERGSWARPPVAGGNVDHIALRLQACDQETLRRHLADRRVEVVEERVNDESQGRTLSLYVRDPSGNTIELMGASL